MATTDYLNGAGLAQVYEWERQEFVVTRDIVNVDAVVPENFAILARNTSSSWGPLYEFNTGKASSLGSNVRLLVTSPGFHLTSNPYARFYYNNNTTGSTEYIVVPYNNSTTIGRVMTVSGSLVTSLYGINSSSFYVIWSSTYNSWFINTINTTI